MTTPTNIAETPRATPTSAPTVIPASLVLSRDSSFGAVLFSGLGSLVYPFLPPAVKAAMPLPAFTVLCGAVGAVCQRLIAAAWNGLLGDIATESAAHIRTYFRLRRLQWYIRTNMVSPARGRALTREIVEADIRRDLPSIPRALHRPRQHDGD
jgi:hypothetical protein